MDDENTFADENPEMAAEAALDAEKHAETDSELDEEQGSEMESGLAARPGEEAGRTEYADDALVDLEGHKAGSAFAPSIRDRKFHWVGYGTVFNFSSRFVE